MHIEHVTVDKLRDKDRVILTRGETHVIATFLGVRKYRDIKASDNTARVIVVFQNRDTTELMEYITEEEDGHKFSLFCSNESSSDIPRPTTHVSAVRD